MNSASSRTAPIVFVVGEDSSVRQSLETSIRSEGWQSETCKSAQEFLTRPRPIVPSCLVLDVSLPDLKGLDSQKRVASERPDTAIVFITDYGDVATSVRAMKAGAVDFLLKPFKPEVLLNAIRECLERSRLAVARGLEMHVLQNRYASLTQRERQVMALVAFGLLNKQVAAELGISEITVKAHRGRVMQKMRAGSFAELVKTASRLSLELSRVSTFLARDGLGSDYPRSRPCRPEVGLSIRRTAPQGGRLSAFRGPSMNPSTR
jgi:FixJ family two-component response regulator